VKAVVDEGVPRDLVKALQTEGCDVSTFPKMWRGLQNGKLIARIEEAGLNCLVTCDKNMEWQQSLRGRKIALVVLPYQKLGRLLPIVGLIAKAISKAETGVVTRVGGHQRSADA
jgi:hypothetical protein